MNVSPSQLYDTSVVGNMSTANIRSWEHINGVVPFVETYPLDKVFRNNIARNRT